MNSADCKQMIVDYCLVHKDHIKNQFDPPLLDAEWRKTLSITNWKRITKETNGLEVTRCFDCKPFDDQLRATIVTAGNTVISVNVEGE